MWPPGNYSAHIICFIEAESVISDQFYYLHCEEFLPLRSQIILNSQIRPVQGDSPYEETEEDDVGSDGRHPDNLPGRLDSFPEGEVDEDEDCQGGDGERRFDLPQLSEATALVSLEDLPDEVLLGRAGHVGLTAVDGLQGDTAGVGVPLVTTGGPGQGLDTAASVLRC